MFWWKEHKAHQTFFCSLWWASPVAILNSTMRFHPSLAIECPSWAIAGIKEIGIFAAWAAWFEGVPCAKRVLHRLLLFICVLWCAARAVPTFMARPTPKNAAPGMASTTHRARGMGASQTSRKKKSGNRQRPQCSFQGNGFHILVFDGLVWFVWYKKTRRNPVKSMYYYSFVVLSSLSWYNYKWWIVNVTYFSRCWTRITKRV